MEGRSDAAAGQDGQSGRRRDLLLVGLLLTLAAALRLWLLCHTEVAARDSIGFIRYALLFEQQSWAEVLRGHHQHPGYPLTVLAASYPVRQAIDEPARAMQLSAQIASSLAALLLVIPMYYLGKLLLHRAAGFWAALLFQCLPVSGHVLSDGLSESLFLLTVACALLFACQALRDGSPWRFALCGAFCGLAYLTRPEGALLLVSAAAVLLGVQFVSRWRRPTAAFLRCGGALVVAALLVGSPYYLATGQFTNKPSAHQILKHDEAAAAPAGGGAAPLAAVPAVIFDSGGSLTTRVLRGLWGLALELANSFHWFAWLPAVLGMCWYCPLVRVLPGVWVLLVYCALHVAVLCRLAIVVGYVSDRHVLVLLLCGVYPAAGFLWDMGTLAAGWLARRGASARWLLRPGMISAALLVALLLSSLPRTMQTLHGRRAGFRATGEWLAQNAHPADAILDGHGWAHFYAGRVFLEGAAPTLPPGRRPVWYHVVARSKDRAEQPGTPNPVFPSEQEVRARGGTVVYHWPARRGVEQARILVYAVRP